MNDARGGSFQHVLTPGDYLARHLQLFLLGYPLVQSLTNFAVQVVLRSAAIHKQGIIINVVLRVNGLLRDRHTVRFSRCLTERSEQSDGLFQRPVKGTSTQALPLPKRENRCCFLLKRENGRFRLLVKYSELEPSKVASRLPLWFGR